ncbi:MAG: Transcriptional modulator of MazE/toxin, MazF, partial [uncultured bacterium]
GKQAPKKSRVFVVVSRDALIASKFSTVICAPIYSRFDGLSTQVLVGIDEGLKHESAIHCDELVSLPKSLISNFIGTLSSQKIKELDLAMKIALAIDEIN